MVLRVEQNHNCHLFADCGEGEEENESNVVNMGPCHTELKSAIYRLNMFWHLIGRESWRGEWAVKLQRGEI